MNSGLGDNADNIYYSRQILLKEFGQAGQKKLKNKKVMIIGAGGLGHPVAAYLAAAGVGEISVLDFDYVELSNLNRQIFFSPQDQNKSKVDVLIRHLRRQNPFIKVHGIHKKITFQNAEELLRSCDLVVDCSDNFPTKFLLHDFAFTLKKDLVQAAIYKYEGQIHVFAFGDLDHQTADEKTGKNRGCLRCLWKEIPKKNVLSSSCDQVGVVGALVGCLGAIQAMEAIKLMVGIVEKPLSETMMVDLLDFSFRRLQWKKNPECFLCASANVEQARGRLSEQMYLLEHCDARPLQEYELKGLAQKDYILIDIREKKEIEEYPLEKKNLDAAIKDFYWWPLSEWHNWKKMLKNNEKYLFICASGYRSSRLTQMLRGESSIPTQARFFSLYGGLNFYRVD